MSDATPEPRPEAAWAQVLGRIEDSLGQSLAFAEPAEGPAPPAEQGHGPATRTPLEVLDDRLAGLQAALDQAEANAAAADALLVDAARGLDQWTGGARKAGRRLAEWAGGAV